jgi:hypothetical protein
MNAMVISYEGHAMDYQADYRRAGDETKPRRGRKLASTRRSPRPAGFNGVHRRRNKRWTW